MKRTSKTISQSASCVGIGLHTGVETKITLHSASNGIRFLVDSNVIPATLDFVSAGNFRSSLSNNGSTVDTVEHLMAALAATEITDIDIELNGTEVPVFDGSSITWLEIIEQAGVTELDNTVDVIEIDRELKIHDGDAWCSIEPCNTFKLDYCLDYDHPLLTEQCASFTIDQITFAADIAPSRTFGFLSDLEDLRNNGLATAAGLHNVLVFDNKSVVNQEGMRWPNEPARHKILDAVGDLYLVGRPILGHFKGFKSGHSLNHQLARMILDNR